MDENQEKSEIMTILHIRDSDPIQNPATIITREFRKRGWCPESTERTQIIRQMATEGRFVLEMPQTQGNGVNVSDFRQSALNLLLHAKIDHLPPK